ncbi:hypothetical protein KM043_012055 [Ampulex compressa]|nr:hypothetical protein KM043_012055 [Ampulex compressa]
MIIDHSTLRDQSLPRPAATIREASSFDKEQHGQCVARKFAPTDPRVKSSWIKPRVAKGTSATLLLRGVAVHRRDKKGRTMPRAEEGDRALGSERGEWTIALLTACIKPSAAIRTTTADRCIEQPSGI